jgi:hypothetical protein
MRISSQMRFDTSEHLRGRAEVEAPRVVLVGVHGGVGSVRHGGSLEAGEAVGVEAAANLGGVADDLEFVPGAGVGGDVTALSFKRNCSLVSAAQRYDWIFSPKSWSISLLRRLLVWGWRRHDSRGNGQRAPKKRGTADGDRPFPCSFCGVSSPHLFLRKTFTPLTAPPHDRIEFFVIFRDRNRWLIKTGPCMGIL